MSQGSTVLPCAAAETVGQVRPDTAYKAAMSMLSRSAGLLRLAATLCWLLGSVKRLALPTPQRNMSVPLDILGCSRRPCMRTPGLNRPCLNTAWAVAHLSQRMQASVGLSVR